MPLIDLTPKDLAIIVEALNYRRQAQADGDAPYKLKKDNERDTDLVLAKLRELGR